MGPESHSIIMWRRHSDFDPVDTAIEASKTPEPGNMGRAYRTPSPAKSAYISSSTHNSPVSASAVASYESQGYMQRNQLRAIGIAAVENEKHLRRHIATLSDFQEMFDTHRAATGPSPNSNHEEGIAQPQEIGEPATPTRKRVRNYWYGLPSPETPNSKEKVYDPLSPVSNDGLSQSLSSEVTENPHGARKSLQQAPTAKNDDAGSDTTDEKSRLLQETTEHNARLARELEEDIGSTTIRRSGRLRAQRKPTYTNELSVVAPRKAAKVAPAAPEASEQPEYSIPAFTTDPIPFEELPTVHSLSWQLQYPPSGSTHPSYPFPTLDPRLIFHQAFVPIVNGLPDLTRVPKLVLPIGWKHVSWSGLLPIAFDPYQQAFKLTPVGPMPLTCEELHQGGLYKYVPGGESHPECGLLPDLVKLSDGSDGEVFNFEGIDWTLPWGNDMNFDAPNALGTNVGSISGNGSISSPAFMPSLTIIAYSWNEATDCPNQVFDLSDAWRWLSTKEVQPTAEFIPTSQKKWRGTGAFRSVRKLKSPIPELMMIAMQPTPSTPNVEPNPLLQNQDRAQGSGKRNLFCPFQSIATPSNVNITLLADTEYTVMELLCYFPQHFHWGHAVERLSRAGFVPSAIRNMVNMVRQLGDEAALTVTRIGSATNAAKKRDLVKAEEMEDDAQDGDVTQTETQKGRVVDQTLSYTAEGWTYDVWEKIDYPLLALAHGLQSLPIGSDAGPLTALILWCRTQGRYQVLLSEVPTLLKEANIERLIEPGEDECPDKEVFSKHAEAMKKDRIRVVKSTHTAKRRLETKEESKGKRKKTD